MDGFLGTSASFSADATLLAYVVILAPAMIVGFLLARNTRFGTHKLVMTFIVLTNWVLIITLMIVSYSAGVAPGLPDNLSEIANLLPTLHLATGTIAQLLATYLVILMWTENTALERLVPFRISRIKGPMRLTLGLWLATIALGAATYIVWYAQPATALADNVPAPIVTEEAPTGETSEIITPLPPEVTEEADE